MATHDTEPQWPPPEHAEGRDPDAAPAPATHEAPDASYVRELLADVVRAPLPKDGVATTNGENAAAYDVAPHLPPRATVQEASEPAVILNTTQPMAARPLGAEAEPALTNGCGKEPVFARRPALQFDTEPSARKRQSRALATAAVFGAGLLVIGAVLFAIFGTASKGTRARSSDAYSSAVPALPATTERADAPSEPPARPPEPMAPAASMPVTASPRAPAPVKPVVTPREPSHPAPSRSSAAPSQTSAAAEPKLPPAAVVPTSSASKFIPEERY